MSVVGYSTRIDLPNLHRQTSIYADIKREGIDMNLSSAGPTRDGYTFIGWSKPLTNITADITVVAQYVVASGLENIDSEGVNCSRKELRNGHVIVIMPDGREFDTTGKQVR